MELREDITHLRDLQAIDLMINKLDEEMDVSNLELEKRRKTIDGRKAKVIELQEKIANNEKLRRELEATNEDELARIKERQTKLMNVQTNREYQSLLKETEDGKKANKQREEDILKLMEQYESLKKRLEEESNLCEEEEKSLAEESGKVEKSAAKLSSQKSAIEKERETKIKDVPANLLKKYDLLREKRNGLAVVAVTEGICHGCHMNIPPQLYNELLKDEKLLSCPTCNRIMFIKPENEE